MLKRAFIGLSIALLVVISSAMLLCNWSATGLKTLVVPTTSMVPAIPKNSLVLVKSVPATSLKVGDVITYINPLHRQQTISHRIIKTYTLSGRVPAFVTKGDANKVPDVPVTSGSVVGKVVLHVPYAGAWLIGSKTWLGIALLVYLPATILLYGEIKRLTDYLRLSMPRSYQLYGLRPLPPKSRHLKLAASGAVVAGFVVVSALFAQPALALLRSNPVALSPNILRVAQIAPPPSNTCHNNTNINVNNSSSQTATSGSGSTSGNTTGGSAASGNASNSNSTNVNVSVTNGC